MKKSILILAMLVLGTMAGYSQMIYDFKKGELVDDQTTKKRATLKSRVAAGEIYLKSGEILEGNFKIPEVNVLIPSDIKITCFPSGDKKQIKTEDINIVKVFSTSNTPAHTFIFSSYMRMKMELKNSKRLAERSFDEHDLKENVREYWMLQVRKGKADLYVSGHGFFFKKDGSMAPFVKGDNMSTPPIVYLGQIEGRDKLPVAIHLAGKGGTPYYFSALGRAFFEGHPIADKIKNKEEGYFKNIDIIGLFDEYNKGDDR